MYALDHTAGIAISIIVFADKVIIFTLLMCYLLLNTLYTKHFHP